MSEDAQTFEVLTLFPAAVEQFVGAGVLGKAIERGLVRVLCTDIRDFSTDKHRTVDDSPFGGGAGMVLKPEPVVAAIESVEKSRGPLHMVLLTPAAPRFDQRAAERLARVPRIGLLCGRYEGIDERVREHFVDECISLGDFVLGGGEVAALAIVEAVARLRSGVLGNPESIISESFAEDGDGAFLEYPQYTRPAEFLGHRVPAVLLGGDHGAIAQWRRAQARRRTWEVRPDLRRVPSLPEGVSLHLAFDTATPPDGIAELARGRQVASVLPIGAGAEEALAWVRALQGRLQVTAFADLKTLRRRFRQRTGRLPKLVAVTRTAGSAIRDARELLDALALESGDAVVLWLTERHSDGSVDAVFAPSHVETDPEALAPGAVIDDASRRPPHAVVELAQRALSMLREP